MKVHQIACRKKTDKVDSRILADLLRTGYLPVVYILGGDVLRFRDLARHRAGLVRKEGVVEVQDQVLPAEGRG